MRQWTVGIVSIVALGMVVAAFARSPKKTPPPQASVSEGVGPRPYDLGDCPDPTPSQGTRVAAGATDAKVRASAQRGLTFLENRATVWNRAHDCFGCHVHAVTVEALSVGMDNDYNVNANVMSSFIEAMTTGPGGSRSPGGFDYAHGNSLRAASKGFGGASLARYDALVSGTLRDDLLSAAQQLVEYQDATGAVVDPENWVNRPVGIGRVQLTAQAVSTWRQAYDRTADEAWLASIGKAEGWLTNWLHGVSPANADLQELNYALVGLLESGGTVSEGKVADLIAGIQGRQNGDGGWSVHGSASDPYATGQTLYTLRRLGLSDADATIQKGTAWLMSNQAESGGWRAGGQEKAEAMWAVLGLVSVDVMTLSVTGITDGQHVSGTMPIQAVAAANGEEGVRQVELLVDDIVVAGACGTELQATFDARQLATGPHLVEALAVDGAGRRVRRRMEVYAGTHYLLGVGTKWDDGGTRFSARNIAPANVNGTVKLEVFTLKNDAPEEVVFSEGRSASQGAIQFWWQGTDYVGARLLSRMTFRNAAGEVVQTVDHPFVHADPATQRASYGDVAGRVQFADGVEAQNAMVELVNEAGEVIGTSRTTKDGNYRFKNLEARKYRVRVRKEGRQVQEAEVEPAASEDAMQDFELDE